MREVAKRNHDDPMKPQWELSRFGQENVFTMMFYSVGMIIDMPHNFIIGILIRLISLAKEN